MRVETALVAALLVLSGCNGVLGAGTGTPTGTVTPAPVPTGGEPSIATTESSGCSIPPPRTPDAPTATKPTAVRPLGLTNGTVDGERLVEVHAAALGNVSYTLRADDEIAVRALENASAFTYRGIRGFRFVQAYAVGGTLYTLEPDGDGGYRVERNRYRPEVPARRQFEPSLAAAEWLGDRMRWFEYAHVETLALNGTTLRVLRAEFERPINLRQRVIVDVESVVYVDRRGIIRKLDHRQKLRLGPADDGEIEWQNDTFAVTDVGTTRLRRPGAFCTLQPEPLGRERPGPRGTTGG